MNHTKYYTEMRLCELGSIRNHGGINCKLVEPAWVYTLNKKTGEITEVEGTYWKNGLHSCFLIKDTYNFYENLPDEAKVYHSDRLWLSKQDKNLAAFMFGVYYHNKISKLVEETDRLTDIAERIHC